LLFFYALKLKINLTVSGAGSAAQSTFELLDVKHMQLDSLGWLHCSHLSATGHISMSSAHYEATLKFFTANYKDVSNF
jgi:N-terminal acetyltransferase B complex non-catalytic subunit